ncbi:hypothetical protein [Elioraea sp.]|uniref:hypothetical protein n=1 Tax=Elioraea sp. TaxID=2185103 RepID=UPI0025C3C6D7|nr:hypothetical protein [Elioraea sp.]
MEAGQIFGLVAGAMMLVLLWPAARRLGASGTPMLRWAALWVAAAAAVMLVYAFVLEPMGVGLR